MYSSMSQCITIILVLTAHTSGRANIIDTVPFAGSSTRLAPDEFTETTSTGVERLYWPGLDKYQYGWYV